MARKKANPNAVPGQHIFPDDLLTGPALRWKELVAEGRTAEAMPILEEIIIASTRMFERFAQYQKYHTVVELSSLVSVAQLLVPRWLLRWEPSKGKLFSWFSQCAKNAFKTEVNRAVQYGARFYSAGDNLETLFGSEDHGIDKQDLADELKRKIQDITVRWGDPQEIGAMRFMVDSLLMEDHDKSSAIRGACYAWGISPEMSKFFYRSALIILRTVMFHKAHMPFTEYDLFLHQHSYEPIVDLNEIIGWENTKKVISILGGTRIKIPTLKQMSQLREKYEVYEEVVASDQDPASIRDIAKARKKSTKSAQEMFEEMCVVTDRRRSGEYQLYDE